MPSLIERDSGHVAELNGIRGIAILMVVVYHYVACVPNTLEPGTLYSYLLVPTAYFLTGVDLFFVLSGFLIGGIILERHENPSFLRVFWIRRACRILPPLALLLVTCWLLASSLNCVQFGWLFDDLMPWWTYATFTQNIFMGLRDSYGGHFLGVTWSLAVEEQFYFIAPLLIVLLGRKNWLKSLVPLIFVALLLRLSFPGFHVQVNTLFRMDSLLCGVLLAVAYRNEATWLVLRRGRGGVLAIFSLLLAITAVLIWRKAFGVFGYSWFSLLYSLFILSVLLYRDEKLTSFFRSGFLCFWGLISYGLYMYHQAVSGLLHGWLRAGSPPSLVDEQAQAVTLLAILCSTLIAWLSFKYFESVFLRIGRRHSYSV